MNGMDLKWVVGSWVIGGILFGGVWWVIFGLFGDCIEYREWKLDVGEEGVILCGGCVGRKMGCGVSSGGLSGLLCYGGYVCCGSGVMSEGESGIDMIVSVYMYGGMLVWIVVIIVLLA